MLLIFTRITNLLLEFYTRKTHEYKRPVNTRACIHASELVTSIGCHKFTRAHKHARARSQVKGLNTRVLIEVDARISHSLASWCTEHQVGNELYRSYFVYTPTGTRIHACWEHIHSLAPKEVSLNSMPPEPLLHGQYPGSRVYWSHMAHNFSKPFKNQACLYVLHI